jgi:hypothetical protein
MTKVKASFDQEQHPMFVNGVNDGASHFFTIARLNRGHCQLPCVSSPKGLRF